MSKTFMLKKEAVEPEWFVIDADRHIVGRLATKIAMVLMGKHKPIYTPHVDCGDYLIVLNAGRLRFSGSELAHPDHPYFTTKMSKKTYESYSGYPGGRTVVAAVDVWTKHPEKILYEAVRRMLPKNKLGKAMLKKLKLFAGTEHPHQAQNPQDLPDYLCP